MKSLFLDVIPMTKPEFELPDIQQDKFPTNIIEEIKIMSPNNKALLIIGVVSIIAIIFIISVIVKILRNKV